MQALPLIPGDTSYNNDNHNQTRNLRDIPILELIELLGGGVIRFKDMSVSIRVQCVELLLLRGFHVSDVAKKYKVADRTIYRYQDIIRKKNAVRINPDWQNQIVGEMLTASRAAVTLLTSCAHSQTVPIGDRYKCAYLAAQTSFKTLELLRDLGYLNTILPSDDGTPVEDSPLAKADKDKELEEAYKSLRPQDREILIEKLRKDIRKRDEEIKKEALEQGAAQPENITGPQ